MNKLRKLIVTPHLYWRDFLLKRNPELAKRLYRSMKAYVPALAASVALSSNKLPTSAACEHNRKLGELIKTKSYVQAEDLFEDIIQRKIAFSQSEHREFHRLQALCASQCKNWPLAAQRWKKCLALDGKNPSVETLYRLGESLGYSGNRTEAESFILKGIAGSPPTTADFLRLHDLYAAVAEQAKDWPEAIKRWKKRVNLKDEKTTIPSLCNLARCQNRAGQYEDAEKTVLRAIAASSPSRVDSHPPSADLLRVQALYAGLAESRQEWETAAERWKELIKLESSTPKPESYRKLIRSLISAHKFNEVDNIIHKARDVFPDFTHKNGNMTLLDHPVLTKDRFTPSYLFLPLLKELCQHVESRGGSLISFIHPNLTRLEDRSDTEQSMIHSNLKSRIYMLRKLYKYNELINASSDDVMEKLFLVSRVVNNNGIFSHIDYKSKYVNFKMGFRNTVGQCEHYEHKVYCCGSSRYCDFSEDSMTISSLLQEKFNNNNINVKVINASYCGSRLHHQIIKIKSININPGDIIIFEPSVPPNQTKKMIYSLNSLNITHFDLNNYFNSPVKRKDMFIDSGDLNYKGNQYIADIMYNQFLIPKLTLNSPPYKWAEGFVRAVETGTFFTPSADGQGSAADSMPSRVDAAYADVPVFDKGKVGSIVMNCNPITLGHLHLITLASQIVNHLYIFVVEEDRSFFTFADRIAMIRRATAHLKNVVVVPSGRFILSAETFPEYFEKDAKQEVTIDTSNDINIFGRYVAKKFNISIRFIGEEPTDAITRQYNEEMKNSLPGHGVQVIEIPRLESGAEAISASRVRRLLKEHRWDDIAAICPRITVDYIREMAQQGRLTEGTERQT